jgi:hypothetical protein
MARILTLDDQMRTNKMELVHAEDLLAPDELPLLTGDVELIDPEELRRPALFLVKEEHRVTTRRVRRSRLRFAVLEEARSALRQIGSTTMKLPHVLGLVAGGFVLGAAMLLAAMLSYQARTAAVAAEPIVVTAPASLPEPFPPIVGTPATAEEPAPQAAVVPRRRHKHHHE